MGKAVKRQFANKPIPIIDEDNEFTILKLIQLGKEPVEHYTQLVLLFCHHIYIA